MSWVTPRRARKRLMAIPADDANWLQWTINLVLGLFMAVGGGAWYSLNSRIEQLREQHDASEAAAISRAERSDEKTGDAIDKLRDKLEADRALAAVDRTNIMATMVTRAELERQIDRVVNAFTTHGRIAGAAE